jgi:hypothetical protein
MNATFTQTYGNNRQVIYDFKDYDEHDLTVKKICDINYKICKKNKSWFKYSNYIIMFYNSISYPKTFRRTLNTIKNDVVKYMFFSR